MYGHVSRRSGSCERHVWTNTSHVCFFAVLLKQTFLRSAHILCVPDQHLKTAGYMIAQMFFLKPKGSGILWLAASIISSCWGKRISSENLDLFPHEDDSLLYCKLLLGWVEHRGYTTIEIPCLSFLGVFFCDLEPVEVLKPRIFATFWCLDDCCGHFLGCFRAFSRRVRVHLT